MPEETITGKAAKNYARYGWHVFPVHWPDQGRCSCGRPDCDSVAKHPLTSSGAKDATDDLGQIKKWQRRWPEANIGLNVGRSRLVVIDVDPGHGGRVRDLPLSRAGRYTTTVRTGGNGWHMYWEAPPGLDISNSNKRCPPGIHVRAGDGAYVVAPPSRHASGQRYRFLPGREPWNLAPRPLPASLLPILTVRDDLPLDETRTQKPVKAPGTLDAHHPYVSAALNAELDQLASARQGNRNNSLNSAAFNLGQFIGAGLLNRVEIENLLERAAVAIGLSQREAQTTIRSGLEAGIKNPRRQWPDFS